MTANEQSMNNDTPDETPKGTVASGGDAITHNGVAYDDARDVPDAYGVNAWQSYDLDVIQEVHDEANDCARDAVDIASRAVGVFAAMRARIDELTRERGRAHTEAEDANLVVEQCEARERELLRERDALRDAGNYVIGMFEEYWEADGNVADIHRVADAVMKLRLTIDKDMVLPASAERGDT